MPKKIKSGSLVQMKGHQGSYRFGDYGYVVDLVHMEPNKVHILWVQDQFCRPLPPDSSRENISDLYDTGLVFPHT